VAGNICPFRPWQIMLATSCDPIYIKERGSRMWMMAWQSTSVATSCDAIHLKEQGPKMWW
jgi:hypothetical protein